MNTNQNQKNEYSRLYWQCRRGMLELDILLQTFVTTAVQFLNQIELEAFKRLLSQPDNLLLEYLMGRTVPLDKEVARVVEQIRNTASR